MSLREHTPRASVTDDIRVETANLGAGSSPDAIVQLLVAARRTLEQVTVLTAHVDDDATSARVKYAMRAISNAMDERILRGNR